MKVNIVVPIAGRGSRFTEAGYLKAKPFVDVNGYPMIYRVLQNLYYPNAKYILLVRKEHLIQEKDLFSTIKKEFDVKTVAIEGITEGAVCTVLHAHGVINNDQPLVIANSDQIIDVEFLDFIEYCVKSEGDGVIMTFKDPSLNRKWSFAKINKDGIVVEVKEKVPISEHATVGVYMFKRGKDFVDAALDMIVRNDRVNDEFYVCPVYNYMIEKDMTIRIYDIPGDSMHGLGTPEDLIQYLTSIR